MFPPGDRSAAAASRMTPMMVRRRNNTDYTEDSPKRGAWAWRFQCAGTWVGQSGPAGGSGAAAERGATEASGRQHDKNDQRDQNSEPVPMNRTPYLLSEG